MPDWDGRSRGTPLGYRFFAIMVRAFGVSSAYAFLYFVVPYYYLFERNAKRVLTDLYVGHLKYSRRQARRLVWANFMELGKSIIDKMAFMTASQAFHYEFRGHEYLIELANARRGAVLISAHMGNWDVAGNMLIRTGLDVQVNVVMYPGEAKRIKRVMDHVTGGVLFNVIEISDDLSHVIRIRQALRQGEFVCIHADRFVEGARTLQGKFLDSEMRVPAGPFEIAARFKVPVTVVWNIREKKNTYVLTAEEPQLFDDAVDASNHFLERLSDTLRKFPEHWFNYHDVFNS